VGYGAKLVRSLFIQQHQVAHKGATASIPPPKNAGLWEKGYPSNEAVLMMCKEGLAH
jgi:hypothetical protein